MDDDAELPQEMAQRDEPATREKYGHDGPHTAVDHSNSFDCNPVGSIYCPYCPPYAAPQLLSLGAECGQPLAPVLPREADAESTGGTSYDFPPSFMTPARVQPSCVARPRASGSKASRKSCAYLRRSYPNQPSQSA